jgi:hypothetical protein
MQRPLMHGTLLQQSLIIMQLWPYSAQTGPPSMGGRSGTLASVEPPGGGPASPDGGGGPQVPRDDPGGKVQGRPGQQSADVVQPPPRLTHSPPQTRGGTPASPLKLGLGTQAKPQQSALVAHGCPALEPASSHGCPVMVQRGIPRKSCWQTRGLRLTFPAQQLFSALQDVVASLHTAPAGRHALPLSQRPTGSLGFALLQFPTPVVPLSPPKPQQSESVLQISPVGRQPLGG